MSPIRLNRLFTPVPLSSQRVGVLNSGCVMILWSRVTELRDEVGAEDFKEVIALFLDEVEEVIDRLRRDADRSQLEQDLHFLKGSALNLGFATFSDLCQDGERLAAGGDAASVDVAAIVEGYDQSKAAFFNGLQEHLAA